MRRNLYYEDEIVKENFNGFMLKRLLSYASKYRTTYIKVILLLIGTSLLSLVPAMINMVIINRILPKNGIVPDKVLAQSVILLSIWLALSMGAVVFEFITSKVSNDLGNAVICNLREDLFEKLMELGFDYYDNRPTGKILVRITNYTDEIANFFINDMIRVIQNVFLLLLSFVCICFIEIRLALVTFLMSIPLVILMWLLSKALHAKVQLDRNKQSNRTAFVAEDINGLEVIKAFNREELNDEIFEDLSRQYHKAFMNTTRYRELFFPLSFAVVRIMCTIAIYLLSLFIITHGIGASLTLGALVTVASYMQRFSGAVSVICQRLQSITNITSNIERIFEILDTSAQIEEKVDAVDLRDAEGRITFEDVTFSYIQGITVLENIELAIEPGQMVALVGPTGAGKTTIVNLISRFYDVDQGKVTIDGTDIRDITFDSLRKNVGVMMQDTFLFSDTIIENIRFSKPDATDEECMEAAKKVFADEFITRKPEGYQTVISSNGTELSGGEKQLLSFARLVLADPRVIILDEATSNIDTETEKLIQQMFQTLLKGRTSFVIAHRLSTIQNADRILYIDNRGIMEDGTHEELVKKKGMYYKLLNHNG